MNTQPKTMIESMHAYMQRESRRAEQAEIRRVLRLWKTIAPIAALLFMLGFLAATLLFIIVL